ncbi:UbiA family prenyltransferase [Roseococcus sp. YIM B11640]|uniref:UbiA family prenyltransferase n=1 Tax=Roseococcus sp. YIM B11640 TaxID=3133973 RepID=UPI003C7ABD22
MLNTPDASELLPIAVDLDGSLVRIDTLHEALFALLREAPLSVLSAGTLLRQGKATFKRRIALAHTADVEAMPFNEELLAWLWAERAKGRRIGLFTASDQAVADAVAAHLEGLFDEVRGSDGSTNLSGSRKADAIAAVFPEGFVYVGDAPVDAGVFARADAAVLVGDVPRLRASLPEGRRIEAEFPGQRPGWREWRRALRLSHWSKNLLVFVAPLLGLAVERAPEILLEALLLFILMGMLASATYLVNDLFDLSSDRRHPVKQNRPIASGAISARLGAVAAAGLLAAAFALSLLLLPMQATIALLAYLATTLTYSLALKRMPIVDVITLAILFTIRIFAGSVLMDEAVSLWLLTFSMLFFVGLAMVKRYAELRRVVSEGGGGVSARGYTAADLPLLLGAGLASGFSAIVIFTIYLIQEQYPRDIYRMPALLWILVPIIMVWLLRVWHLALHGRMNEDPVAFALHDRFSLALGAVALLVLALAWQ